MSKKKTTEELLEDLITLVTPISNMAKFHIARVNQQTALEKEQQEYIKWKQSQQTEEKS